MDKLRLSLRILALVAVLAVASVAPSAASGCEACRLACAIYVTECQIICYEYWGCCRHERQDCLTDCQTDSASCLNLCDNYYCDIYRV